MYSVHYIQYIVHYIQCTLYTVQCTLYTIYSTVYIVHYIQYSVHCTLYTVQCTLYRDSADYRNNNIITALTSTYNVFIVYKGQDMTIKMITFINCIRCLFSELEIYLLLHNYSYEISVLYIILFPGKLLLIL